MLALNMFEEVGRKQVAARGQRWFAHMEEAPPELTWHPWVGEAARCSHRHQQPANTSPAAPLNPSASRSDLSLVSALGSPGHVAPFSLKEHVPGLTSLLFFPEKLLACF